MRHILGRLTQTQEVLPQPVGGGGASPLVDLLCESVLAGGGGAVRDEL